MWTKLEDLHGKYVKINSEKDYETVSQVLEELGFKYDTHFDKEKYQNRFKSVFIKHSKNYFLSETLLDDIPIQQFYDYLNNKTLKLKDLVEGEIYKYIYINGYYLIGKCSDSKTLRVSNYIQIYDNDENNNLSGSNNCVSSESVQLASTEEKKHFQVCIKQNKFIPKKDLHLYDDITFELKSLQSIPEYVECTTSKNHWQGIFIEGKIYKKHDYASISSINLISEDGLTHHVSYLGTNLSFKPSTKEAYEAQNKPKYEVGKWSEIIELPKSNTFDLSNTKIKVDTPELSRLIQEKAFELGWEWNSGKNIISLDSKYLFFYNKFITFSNLDVTFQQSDFKEIFPSDLGINVVNSETKSKLNPITPEQVFKNYEVVGSFTVSNTVIPKEVIKKKGFDEEEFYSNPFNQVLELPKKSKQNNKKQLILT